MKIQSLLLLLALLLLPGEAQAQSSVRLCNTATPQDCAGITGHALDVNATVSASVTGFTPSASGARMTPLSVATSDSSGNLPTGAVVIVSNVGTTNPMYCNVNGVAATTSDQLITANGGWFAFTIPAAVTTLHCIATGSTTTANGLGGSGIATGTGGGSGGSGGGGAATIADGADVAEGAVADVAATAGSTGTVSAKLRFMTSILNTISSTLTSILSAVQSAIPAGSAIIGYTSNDVCAYQTKLTAAFSTSSAGPVSIVALSGSTKVYVCSISAITDTAIKLSFIDGTGGSCASAQHAIWGSTTAASGMSLAANGGFTAGSGNGTVGVTAAASAFCLLQSGTSLVAGNITYVQQ